MRNIQVNNDLHQHQEEEKMVKFSDRNMKTEMYYQLTEVHQLLFPFFLN